MGNKDKASSKDDTKELGFRGKLVKFLDGSKGRDKVCKIVQYGSRSIKYYMLLENPKSDWGQRFDGLYSTTATGRKLWRMGKSLNEYDSLVKLLASPPVATADYALEVTQRLAFAWYWFFDNVGYLIRAKFVKYDKKETTIVGSYGWFLGCLTQLVKAVYQFSDLQQQLARQLKSLREVRASGGGGGGAKPVGHGGASLASAVGGGASADEGEVKKLVVQLYGRRLRLQQDIVRYACDCVVSFQSAELTPRLLGVSVHDGIMGILGVVSAAINAHQIWLETK